MTELAVLAVRAGDRLQGYGEAMRRLLWYLAMCTAPNVKLGTEGGWAPNQSMTERGIAMHQQPSPARTDCT